MRPKINYIISEKDPNTLCINRGYGREFTSFYNIFSYLQYTFSLDTLTLQV